MKCMQQINSARYDTGCSLCSSSRDDYRMDYDDGRGGVGGGATRIMQRQGFEPGNTTRQVAEPEQSSTGT